MHIPLLRTAPDVPSTPLMFVWLFPYGYFRMAISVWLFPYGYFRMAISAHYNYPFTLRAAPPTHPTRFLLRGFPFASKENTHDRG